MQHDSHMYSSGFIKSTLFIAIIAILHTSCSDSTKTPAELAKGNFDSLSGRNANYTKTCKSLLGAALAMDSILLEATELDKAIANKAIKAFTDYASFCHNDSMSPVYLIKTAQVARAINNIPQAKLVLDKCISDYPGFKDRPAALFLLAQLYDEPAYLNNEEEARQLYQRILNEYPKSEWAASASGAISFIGKSDADILKELKKKRK